MKAMVLEAISDVAKNHAPLVLREVPDPSPVDGEVLVRVSVCGVCHTELDEIEGRAEPAFLPIVPGHQAVGRIVEVGAGVDPSRIGQRVGVAWIHSACGACELCRSGEENLCPRFEATGKDVHGGYAERMTVPEAFAYSIPETFTDVAAAPLLCAGAIGYRSLRLTGLEDGQRLGLTGFGASAHLVLAMARHRFPSTSVYVFARSAAERRFALERGAAWAGDTHETAPKTLHGIIDTTPAWVPVLEALRSLAPGGRLVINAIRKEEADKRVLLALDYPGHLWMEKEIKTVANVARRDVREFLALAAQMGLEPAVERYPLEEANRALVELKTRRVRGAKVLEVG